VNKGQGEGGPEPLLVGTGATLLSSPSLTDSRKWRTRAAVTKWTICAVTRTRRASHETR
jgi:hypothetical protein